jgi:hypothetical protein
VSQRACSGMAFEALLKVYSMPIERINEMDTATKPTTDFTEK